MHKYFICTALISPYQGAEYVIGIYDQKSLAKQAQAEFNTLLSTNEKGDKGVFKNSDHRFIDIKELKIIEYECAEPLSDAVYIVSLFTEGFGQILRFIKAIVGSHKAALEMIEQLELCAEESDKTFPEFFSLEKLQMNQFNPQAIDDWLQNDYFGDNDDYLVWK